MHESMVDRHNRWVYSQRDTQTDGQKVLLDQIGQGGKQE